MIKELDQIVLTRDLPAHNLKSGDVGTVVLVHGSDGYEVEFIAFDGETIAVTSVDASQIRPIGPHEIPHARTLAE